MSQPHQSWNLTEELATKFRKIFDSVPKSIDTPSDRCTLSGEVARKIFLRSGLSREELALIWELSDGDGDGQLDFQEFCTGMFLIMKRRDGQDIPGTLPEVLVNSIGKVIGGVGNGLGGSGSEYEIDREEYDKIGVVFQKVNQGGPFMSAKVARECMLRTKVDIESLAKIWDLADQDLDGKLSEHEFVVSFHLCRAVQKGMKVPEVLPECLKRPPPLAVDPKVVYSPYLLSVSKPSLESSPFTIENPSPELILDCKFTGDSDEVITGASNGNVKIWKVSSTTSAFCFNYGDAINSINTDPNVNGRKFLVASGTKVFYQDAAERKEFTHHTDVVLGSSWKPNTTQFASSSKDKTCMVGDLTNGKILKKFVHPMASHCCDWSRGPKGNLVASGCEDGILRIWNIALENNDPLIVMKGHTGNITACSWIPVLPFTVLASCGTDKNVIVWQISGNNYTHKVLKGHTDVPKSLAWMNKSPNTLVSGSLDSIRIWNTQNYTCTKVIEAIWKEVPRFASHLNGKFVCVSSDPFVIFNVEDKVKGGSMIKEGPPPLPSRPSSRSMEPTAPMRKVTPTPSVKMEPIPLASNGIAASQSPPKPDFRAQLMESLKAKQNASKTPPTEKVEDPNLPGNNP